jgi:hypothetical protein
VDQVANNVAQQIYEAVQQNQLESIAAKPDIFIQGVQFFIALADTNRLSYPGFNYKDVNTACYVSGSSPSLFLYSLKAQPVSITLPSFLTYSDPETTNGNIWNVTTLPNGTIKTINGSVFPYLYYEYNKAKVTFSTPQTGFSIPYNQWENTVRQSIAAKLNLTQPETERLVLEVKNVLFDLPKLNYLTLSLVPEEEINAKLPLSISPKPDTLHRVQILVTPVDQQVSIPTPVLTPLSRSGFTAIELGARGN